MSQDDRDEALRRMVAEEVARALDGLKRDLLAELRPPEAAASVAPPESASAAPGPRISAINAAVHPPVGDPVRRPFGGDQTGLEPLDTTRVSTRGGMHVYGPAVAAEHANFAAPVAMPQVAPDIRPGDHANFAPQVDLRGPLAPPHVQVRPDGGVHSVVDGHANFAAVPHRWVGLGPDRSPPAVRMVLPDGTQVTLPRGAPGPFRVGEYLLAGLGAAEEEP
jgi:hypothetical protein